MNINPQIYPTPDCPTVVIREPQETVDLDKVLGRVLWAQGWGLGIYFDVQFWNHDGTRLLTAGRFVVTEDRTEVQVSDVNPAQTMTRDVRHQKFAQIGAWHRFEGEQEVVPLGDVEVKWNVGKRLHEVIVNGEVEDSDPIKERAEAKARAIAEKQQAA